MTKENEFVELLENYIRKVRRNTLSKTEKMHLLLFYLQSQYPEPPEPTDEEMAENMMLGWYISSLLDTKKVKES